MIKPVKVITASDLEENGGVYLVEKGRPAVPVYGFTVQGGQSVEGVAQPVYVVSEAEFNAGTYRKQRGQPMRVGTIEDLQFIGVLEGREAIPVWAVNDWPITGSVPNAPTNLTATAVSTSQINLAWADNSGDETGFNIYRDNVLIDTVAADETTYQDTGLDPDTTYEYYITAVNDTGESDPSNTASDKTFIELLIHDTFTTDRAAGAVNGTAAEPGPGTRTVVDTSVTGISIASSRLVMDAGAGLEGDPGISWDSFVRAAGLAMLFQDLQFDDNVRATLGWSTMALPSAVSNIRREATALRVTGTSQDIATWAAGATSYHPLNVLQASGSYILLKVGTGSWKLLWIIDSVTTTPMYPELTQFNSTDCDVDIVKVANLGGNWAIANGIRLSFLSGSQSAGQTFTHEADGIIRFTATTLPVASQIEIRFRVQDASNYWQVTIDTLGTLDLDEVVAGTPTQRGTAVAVVSAGELLVLVFDGATINIHDAVQRRINYTSATNFQIETDGELETLGTGGVVSNIGIWPRNMSGDNLLRIQELESL